jgi:hypothetical protein
MLGSAHREARRVGQRQGEELTVSELTRLITKKPILVLGWVEPNRVCRVSYLNPTCDNKTFVQLLFQRAKPNISRCMHRKK